MLLGCGEAILSPQLKIVLLDLCLGIWDWDDLDYSRCWYLVFVRCVSHSLTSVTLSRPYEIVLTMIFLVESAFWCRSYVDLGFPVESMYSY